MNQRLAFLVQRLPSPENSTSHCSRRRRLDPRARECSVKPERLHSSSDDWSFSETRSVGDWVCFAIQPQALFALSLYEMPRCCLVD